MLLQTSSKYSLPTCWSSFCLRRTDTDWGSHVVRADKYMRSSCWNSSVLKLGRLHRSLLCALQHSCYAAKNTNFRKNQIVKLINMVTIARTSSFCLRRTDTDLGSHESWYFHEVAFPDLSVETTACWNWVACTGVCCVANSFNAAQNTYIQVFKLNNIAIFSL